jgi:citrate synthase
MTRNTVTLTDNVTGKTIELPVHHGSHGPACIDIRSLYKELGYFTYDPGFMSTGSCRSEITFIDGDKGQLLYRGYPIEQLAAHSTYLEVCYLLLNGDLPSSEELNEFSLIIKEHSMLHEAVREFYEGFQHNAHPMAIMVGVVGALSAFYHDNLSVHDPVQRQIAAHRLISKMPTIAAWSYKYALGQPFMYPKNRLSYTGNFLSMMFGVPTSTYEPDPLFVRALDLILILHADHEQNASTSTVRLSGSSEANPFAAISAGIASLWGPLHGGANEKVIMMLEEIVHSDKTVEDFVARAKDKDDSFRLMGFGHRVYKNYDPRATIIRDMCHKLLKETGSTNDPIFEVALRLEQIAVEDDYFVERKLYPNVDYYSGIILRAMGIPMNMFTVIFALARTVGWISHWSEMMQDPESRIGRPRQLYAGHKEREYVPIEKR